MLVNEVTTQPVSPYINKQFDEPGIDDIRRSIAAFDAEMRPERGALESQRQVIAQFRDAMARTSSVERFRQLFGMHGSQWRRGDAVTCHIASYFVGLRVELARIGQPAFDDACRRQLHSLTPEARADMLARPALGDFGAIVLTAPGVGLRCPLTTAGMGEGGIHLTQAEAVSLLGASVRPDESRTILQTLSDMKLSDLSMHATYALLNLALDGDGKVPESLDGTAFRKLFCDLFDALWRDKHAESATLGASNFFAQEGDNLRLGHIDWLSAKAADAQAQRVRGMALLCLGGERSRVRQELRLASALHAELAAGRYEGVRRYEIAATTYLAAASKHEALSHLDAAAFAYGFAAKNFARCPGKAANMRAALEQAVQCHGKANAMNAAHLVVECADIYALRGASEEAVALYEAAAKQFIRLGNREEAQRNTARAKDHRTRVDIRTINRALESRRSMADRLRGTGLDAAAAVRPDEPVPGAPDPVAAS
ncbi:MULTISPECIES: hypothetical protein [Pandoraea]|uniref:hypothetical protein n=1 Tax=Pandoraea TaxID=93217 RepID=UPI0003C73B93|nr:MULTISPECIES: hypothetical protein [Pandoraea]AHB08416.1 hypothetical protein U875_10295 [Pandoraea pnomenusa 3kgm]AHB78784.1 hypothetical protein X636_24390 [Pandoraea pnomenusa]AHN77303.1 hypothetical protein DA70_02725 [Pandoraea pnomenusa]ANC46868.1 hypothetical protein A6P55_24615 [Pandoraea pnomenusa]MBN9096449.1 hypothetical protein [Pandoraea pnomenusa]